MTTSPLTRAAVVVLATGGLVLSAGAANAASLTDNADAVITQVNDGVLYGPVLAPTTYAIAPTLFNGPTAPVNERINALYAGLKAGTGL